MMQKYDFILKIISIGESTVGKTCILRRFVNDTFIENEISTVGVDFMTKVINTKKYKIQLQLWDTSGQERFKSIVSGYYKGAVGTFLVFDLSSQNSFDKIDTWYHEVKELAQPACVFALIGNKLDLCPDRQNKANEEVHDSKSNNENNEVLSDIEINRRFVPKEKAEEYAKENCMQYFEVSAKTGENIQNAFNALIDNIVKNLDDGVYDLVQPDSVDFQNEEAENKSCC